MYKLQHTNDKPSVPGMTEYGDHNNPPEPWKQITVDEYIRNSHFPEYVERRQLMDFNGRHYADVKIEWYHSRAYMTVMPNKWKLVDGEVVYDEDMEYYQIGCNHEYRELSQAECRTRGISHFGMCYHVTECTQCGHIYSYDSSG